MFSISQLVRLPIICALCNQYHQGVWAVCEACCQYLKPLGPTCQFCATPLLDAHHAVCGQCCQKRPFFNYAQVGFYFDEPLRTLIHEFKYQEGLYLTSFLAHLMLTNVSEELLKTECLIPVPIHKNRLKQRGYNQALLLAKYLSQAINRPFDHRLCKKIIHTPAQAQLNANQRLNNLEYAFQANPLPYQHVTIVDDLLTTGSTANALAKTLKANGANTVGLWCCARA